MNKTKEKAYNLIHKEIERFFRDECKVDGKALTWTLYNRSITNLKAFVGEKLGEAFELLIKEAKKELSTKLCKEFQERDGCVLDCVGCRKCPIRIYI